MSGHADIYVHIGLNHDPSGIYSFVLDVRQGEGYEPIIDRQVVTPDLAMKVAHYIDQLLNPTGNERQPCKVSSAMAHAVVEARRRMESQHQALTATVQRIADIEAALEGFK